MANSADPDQVLHIDQGLHCLLEFHSNETEKKNEMIYLPSLNLKVDSTIKDGKLPFDIYKWVRLMFKY